MSEKDKKFYWLKLKSEFMNGDVVDFLMSQKNGANYVVLYQMLCMKTINTQGELATKIGDVLIPFNIDKIQRECKWFDVDTIRVAMEMYRQLGLLYEQENGIIKISNFQEMVGSETYWAKQKRKQFKEFVPNKDFKYIKQISYERALLPNGKTKFVDNKRYGGNGFLALDRSQGKCEICGSEENICIHHNNGYSNELQDLLVVCRSCHRKIESKEKEIGNSLEQFQKPLISKSNNLLSNNKEYNNFSDRIKEGIQTWLNYKKEKGQTYKQTGLTTLLNKVKQGLEQYGEQAVIESIDNCISNNYAGLFINAPKTYSTNKKKDSKDMVMKQEYTEEEISSIFRDVNDINIDDWDI